MFSRLSRLSPPARILDIGAHDGSWARTAQAVWPHAHIHCIEANWAFDLRPFDHTHVVLSDRQDELVSFWIMDTGSSMFEENQNHPKRMDIVRTATLDSLGLQADLIKVDVQGAELVVLKGGERTLAGATAVVLELSLVDYNIGAPLADEVMAFMANRGWFLTDIVDIHSRNNGALIQFDGLFLRQDHYMRQREFWGDA